MDTSKLFEKYNILYDFLMKLKISVQNENNFLELEDFENIQSEFINTYRLSYNYYSNNDDEKIIPSILSLFVLDMKEFNKMNDPDIKIFTDTFMENINIKIDKYKEELYSTMSETSDIPYNILNFLYLFGFIEMIREYTKNKNSEIVIESSMNNTEIETFFNDILKEDDTNILFNENITYLNESKIIGFGNNNVENISDKFIKGINYLIYLINYKRKNINSKSIYDINILSFCIISMSMLWCSIFSVNN